MEDITLEIPEDFKDKGFLKATMTDDGKISLNKLLKKVENQESILGKRALPTRDSSEEEINEFINKMSSGFNEDDFNPVLEGLDTASASELKKACKEAGMTPQQTKKFVEAHKKLVDKKYSKEEFQKLLADKIKTDERLNLAKMAMGDEEWEAVMKSQNDDAIRVIVAAANLGEKYNVKESTTGAGTQPSTKVEETGFCQGYVDEMRAIAARGGSQAEKDACMKKWKVLE